MTSAAKLIGLAGAATALAMAPTAAAEPTVTAVGSAQVKPTPQDRNSDASIRVAVEEAEDAALPRAVAEARSYATKLATAGNLQLGALVSISNVQQPTLPFYYPSQAGTFPGGKYCGDVPRIKTVVSNGKRRRVRSGTHRVCRVPGSVTVSVTVTYAVATG